MWKCSVVAVTTLTLLVRSNRSREFAGDTFVAKTWRDERGVCLSLNSERCCGFGYTIGDGWKLIYYPEHFPAWFYAVLNMFGVAGWTVGVGWA